MQFCLDKWFGQGASFLIDLVFVLLILLIPIGILGAWRARSLQAKQGREYLARLLSEGAYEPEESDEDE